MDHEMQLSPTTGVKMDAHLREVCEEACIIGSMSKIGGPTITVEIDESKIGKRKYNR